MGWHYRRSYETVLVAEKPGAACRWFDESSKVENIIRPGGRIRKIIPTKDDHQTPKPSALAEHFVSLHTRPGDLVLDSFMGCGWVAIACVALGRRFIGIELDEEYFDIAVRRIKDAMGYEVANKDGMVQRRMFVPDEPSGNSPADMVAETG